MSRWISIPLDRPVAVGMLLICLTVLGIVAVTQIPIGFASVLHVSGSGSGPSHSSVKNFVSPMSCDR